MAKTMKEQTKTSLHEHQPISLTGVEKQDGKIETDYANETYQIGKQTRQAEEARKTIEQTADAKSSNKVLEADKSLTENEENSPDNSSIINRELLDVVKHREIKNLQRQHPAPQRALSRIVHQPFVSSVSELSSKTVSRPSGLLGGSLLALIGSAGYYYLAKRIGFKYNYLIFFILFVGGFLVGLTLELALYLVYSKRRRLD